MDLYGGDRLLRPTHPHTASIYLSYATPEQPRTSSDAAQLDTRNATIGRRRDVRTHTHLSLVTCRTTVSEDAVQQKQRVASLVAKYVPTYIQVHPI